MTPIIIMLLAGSTALALGTFIWAQYSKMNARIASKISDQEIVLLAQKLGGVLSATDLVAHAGLNMAEAKAKINEMLQSGILSYKMKGFKVVYQLSGASPHVKPQALQHATIKDADVLRVAVNAGGKISVNALCLNLNISVEEAKDKLASLHAQGVFEVQVNETGTLIYILPDLDLLA